MIESNDHVTWQPAPESDAGWLSAPQVALYAPLDALTYNPTQEQPYQEPEPAMFSPNEQAFIDRYVSACIFVDNQMSEINSAIELYKPSEQLSLFIKQASKAIKEFIRVALGAWKDLPEQDVLIFEPDDNDQDDELPVEHQSIDLDYWKWG